MYSGDPRPCKQGHPLAGGGGHVTFIHHHSIFKPTKQQLLIIKFKGNA